MTEGKLTERDLKRFDDATDKVETAALVLGFVNLFLAIWARTPDLKVDPGSGVGLSIVGFNVGYAIVFGPLLSFVSMAYLLGLLSRRDLFRSIVLDSDRSGGADALSPGDSLALGCSNGRQFALSDRLWRGAWYFCLPPLTTLVIARRYFDFVPDEAAKTWSLWERAWSLLFTNREWAIRPILPTSALEGPGGAAARLPYIYAPVSSWAEVVFCVATTVLAWRAARLYFHATPAQQPL